MRPDSTSRVSQEVERRGYTLDANEAGLWRVTDPETGEVATPYAEHWIDDYVVARWLVDLDAEPVITAMNRDELERIVDQLRQSDVYVPGAWLNEANEIRRTVRVRDLRDFVLEAQNDGWDPLGLGDDPLGLELPQREISEAST
jgi:hypothetical protein